MLAKANERWALIHWFLITFRMGNLLRWPVAIKLYNYLPKMAFDSVCWVKCTNLGFGQPPYIRLDHQWLALNIEFSIYSKIAFVFHKMHIVDVIF